MIFKLPTTRQVGGTAEDIAVAYLDKQGLKIHERNFHCRFGEIDIVAFDGQSIVFIEVRYRRDERYLAVVETVDPRKTRKIIKTSEHYLNQHKSCRPYTCRFDVIAMTGSLEAPVIKWIKNAFQV